MRTPTPEDPIRVKVSSGDGSQDWGLGNYIGDEVIYSAVTPDGSILTNSDPTSPPDLSALPPGSKMMPPRPNPVIKLDDGRTVYGAQCWWQAVDAADANRKTKNTKVTAEERLDITAKDASEVGATLECLSTLKKELGITGEESDSNWSLACMSHGVGVMAAHHNLNPEQMEQVINLMWRVALESCQRMQSGQKFAGVAFENGNGTAKSFDLPKPAPMLQYPDWPTEWQRKQETLVQLLDRMEAVDPKYYCTPQMFTDIKHAATLLKKAQREHGESEMVIEAGRLKALQEKMAKATSEE